MAILLILILSIKVINLGVDLYTNNVVHGLAKAKVIQIQRFKSNNKI